MRVAAKRTAIPIWWIGRYRCDRLGEPSGHDRFRRSSSAVKLTILQLGVGCGNLISTYHLEFNSTWSRNAHSTSHRLK